MTGKSIEVHGGPEIARPNKVAAIARDLFPDAPRAAREELKALFNELLPYERQLALVYAWFFKMQKLASEYRHFHQEDIRRCVVCLVPVNNSTLGGHDGRLLSGKLWCWRRADRRKQPLLRLKWG